MMTTRMAKITAETLNALAINQIIHFFRSTLILDKDNPRLEHAERHELETAISSLSEILSWAGDNEERIPR